MLMSSIGRCSGQCTELGRIFEAMFKAEKRISSVKEESGCLRSACVEGEVDEQDFDLRTCSNQCSKLHRKSF